jgi:hypothetical protein
MLEILFWLLDKSTVSAVKQRLAGERPGVTADGTRQQVRGEF